LILVGGLGGGGDSAGSLSLAIALKHAGADVAILGMVNCRVRDVVRSERVAGSLLRVSRESWAGGRFFEPLIAELGWETYVLCLREPLRAAVEGLESLREQGARAIVGVDFGGDALVRGDEPEVGSAWEDAMGLAVLVKASELGLASVAGVGALGAEWGGCIPMGLLTENLLEVSRMGGYLGSYEPSGEVLREFAESARQLLRRVPSFMLTVYLDALEGKLGEHYYDVAYFRGTFEVRRYHRYIYVFKPEVLGSFNQLCQLALRVGDLGRLERAGRRVRQREGVGNWEEVLLRLARRKWDYRSLLPTERARRSIRGSTAP